MSRKRVTEKIVKFAENKGFYIILALCILAIGVSGYVLFFTGAEPAKEPDTSLFDTEYAGGSEYWLPQEDRELVILRYINDVPVSVLAELYGISRFKMGRRIKCILDDLRKSFKG